MNKIPCREKVWIPLNNVLEKRNLTCAKVVDNPRKATPEVAVQLILQTCKNQLVLLGPIYTKTCTNVY